MRLSDFARAVNDLDHVTESRPGGLLAWRYRGRLVARQLDDTSIVIRSSFDARDLLVRSFPGTFCVPQRFARHMMVVADLRRGDDDAIEEAILAAWALQAGQGGSRPAD